MMLWPIIVQFGFAISLLVNAILFIPQAYTIYKSKNVEGCSLITFAGFNVIQLFTVFHGFLTHDYLLVTGYLLSILTCGTVSVLVFYYRYVKPSAK